MIKIGMEELEEARRLQKEAARLHLPVPPVASFKIQKIDNNACEQDILYSKSNSYLRNAYNTLMGYLCFPNSVGSSVTFGPGIVSWKDYSGSIYGSMSASFTDGTASWTNIRLGKGTTPDTLDDYTIETEITEQHTINTSRQSFYDSNTSRLITYYQITLDNISEVDIPVSEVGVTIGLGPNLFTQIMMVRDVFPTVIVHPGEQIRVTYQFEVYYPE